MNCPVCNEELASQEALSDHVECLKSLADISTKALIFKRGPNMDNKPTWWVFNKSDNTPLGSIEYCKAYKGLSFYPYPQMVFATVPLLDIAYFCQHETLKLHKGAKMIQQALSALGKSKLKILKVLVLAFCLSGLSSGCDILETAEEVYEEVSNQKDSPKEEKQEESEPKPGQMANTPPRDLVPNDDWTLFKPKGQDTKKLVLVIDFRIDLNDVQEITVNGEEGNFYYPEWKDGVPRNGGRGVSRYDYEGAHYGRNISVIMIFKDGTTKDAIYPDGSQRGEIDWE